MKLKPKKLTNKSEDEGLLKKAPQFFVFSSNQGHKRRFALAGAANASLTNLLLQVLLSSPAIPVGLATLASQLISGVIGYTTYTSFVFKGNKIFSSRSSTRFFAMATMLWSFNWFGIEVLMQTGIPTSICGILMVTPLAVISYKTQKHWVFKR